MPSNSGSHNHHRRITLTTFAVLLTFFVCGLGPAFAGTVDLPGTGQNHLLQFRSGGHVLGFEKTGIYAATGSHALRIGFGGTEGVEPESSKAAGESGNALPLEEVRYPELWPGITLAYTRTGSGVFESTYYVAPHGDVNAIYLQYNAPVELTAGGSLSAV